MQEFLATTLEPLATPEKLAYDLRMSKNPDLSEAIENVGGVVAAAKLLDVTGYQNIQHWLRVGQVPAIYCPRLEQASGVSRFKLRPCDSADIWPELLETVERKAA